MATLLSPGVPVTLVDDNFWKYDPDADYAQPGFLDKIFGIKTEAVTLADEKWDNMYAAVCREEDRLWVKHVEELLYGNKPLFEEEQMNEVGNIPMMEWSNEPVEDLEVPVETDAIKFVQELIDNMLKESDQKVPEVIDQTITYTPVKPVDMITIDIKWDWNYQSDDLNIVDPSVNDGKMRLVNALSSNKTEKQSVAWEDCAVKLSDRPKQLRSYQEWLDSTVAKLADRKP